MEDENPRNSLSEAEVIDQGILFMISGYDTTTAALTSAAYCLATNPACQEKLLQEVEFVNLDSNGSEFDYEALESLKYLDAFICEVLRFMPPVPR